MIQRYKIFFRKILEKKGIDGNKNDIVLRLKKNYEDIKSKLVDQELFNYYLGENFDNECTNVEDINSDNDNEKDKNINEEKQENKDIIKEGEGNEEIIKDIN